MNLHGMQMFRNGRRIVLVRRPSPGEGISRLVARLLNALVRFFITID